MVSRADELKVKTRIAELEAQLAERDRRIAELEADVAQCDAEADADSRQQAIESLSRTLEAETQRADRAEAERDEARRETIDEWSARFSAFGLEPKRLYADKRWGDGEGQRLFPQKANP